MLRVIIIFSYLILSSVYLYAGEVPSDEKIFSAMKEQLFTICAPEGKFLYNTIVQVKQPAGVINFNCNAHLLALIDMGKEMQKRKQFAYQQHNLALSCPVSMAPVLPKVQLPVVPLKKGTQCKRHDGLICSGAFICSMVTGPFHHLMKKIHTSVHRLNKLTQECGDMNSYQCLASALRGVWDNLFISAQAIWKLLGMAKNGVIWLGHKSYDKTIGSLVHSFSGVEKVTSDQMLVASSMESSLWKQFKTDPVKVAKELAAGFFKVLTAGIKENYGCQKWSGTPFMSKCLVPMQDWDCASCMQKMNSICGVLGFAGGELVVAYLTGGATVVAKKMIQYGVRGGQKLVNRVLRPIKAYRIAIKSKRASQVIQTTANATMDVAEVTVRVGMSMKLRDLIGLAGRVTFRVGKKVANTKVFSIVTATTKKIMTPVRKYIQLTDWAFLKGYNHVASIFMTAEQKAPGVLTKFMAKNSKSAPRILRFVSDKEIGINVKTYGSYVASFDRGKRGRAEANSNPHTP